MMEGCWVDIEDLPEVTAGAKEFHGAPGSNTRLWQIAEGRWLIMRNGDDRAWCFTETEAECFDDGDEVPIEEVLDELGV